jgi:hypothetical protein
MKNSDKIVAGYVLAFCAWMLFQGNAGNPPDGRTNAPFDGYCTGCHNPNNSFTGTVEISGVPETVEAGETYTITLSVTVTSGSAVRAGFQLVSVFASDNTNAGDLIPSSNAMGTNVSGNREYIDHRGARNFDNNVASWTFDWVAPGGPDGAVITMYYAGNITNGNGGSNGDRPVSGSSTFTLSATSVPLVASISSKLDVMCTNDSSGEATVEANGGTLPYTYMWSSGSDMATATGLAAGDYTVTVTDNTGMSTTASVTINQQDMLGPDIPTSPATIYLNELGQASYDIDQVLAAIMDNCGVESTEFSKNTFDCNDLGEQNITITALDAASNSSTGMIPLTILDTISPFFITCVEDINVAVGEVVTYQNPAADDNCGVVELLLTEGLASGNVFPEGETKVSYMATDASGNIACCSFIVRVEMTTATDDQNDLVAELLVYPNPARDHIKVYFNESITGNFSMRIFEPSGKMVDQINYPASPTREVSIDIAHLPPGVYYLKIDLPEFSTVRKMMVPAH